MATEDKKKLNLERAASQPSPLENIILQVKLPQKDSKRCKNDDGVPQRVSNRTKDEELLAKRDANIFKNYTQKVVQHLKMTTARPKEPVKDP